MKIPQKKIVRKLLSDKYRQALKGYYYRCDKTENQLKHYANELINRTFEIIESVKIKRSKKELHFYWIFMYYLQSNTPDMFAEKYREVFHCDRKIFTKEFWHQMMKEQFGKESFDYYSMDGYEAMLYVNDVVLYAADNIYYIETEKPEDRIDELSQIVKEWYDSVSKGKILLYD